MSAHTLLLSQRQLVGGNWVTQHYSYDGGGNVRLLADASGAVSDTFDYDAYGNLIGRTGTTANNYLYRGQQFDADLGFYYKRTRYYSQQRGRFLTMDPHPGLICQPRTLHKYSYAGVDPVNRSDPSGMLELAGYGLTRYQVFQAAVAATELGLAVSCVIYRLASQIWPGELDMLVPPLFRACLNKKRENDCLDVLDKCIDWASEGSDKWQKKLRLKECRDAFKECVKPDGKPNWPHLVERLKSNLT